MTAVLRLSWAGNHRFVRSFLCLVAACILFVCASYERPEFEKPPLAEPDSIGFILSSGNGFYDVASNEFTGYSVIKSIALRNPASGRLIGFRALLSLAVLSTLFTPTHISLFFHPSFYGDPITSHSFIIAYIHNLDGMKP